MKTRIPRFLLLALIFSLFIILLPKCSSDSGDNTEEPQDTPLLYAVISGSDNFTFSSVNPVLSDYFGENSKVFRLISGYKYKSSEKYILKLYFKYSDTTKTYDLTDSLDGYASLYIYNDNTKDTIARYFSTSGKIEVTILEANRVKGTYNFEAKTIDGTKSVSIKNGRFYIVRG